ncbi:MAG: toll/interleukin-1 receptor domain-containing protein [Phycisphaerales bacterium]
MRSESRVGNLFLSYVPQDRERVRKIANHLSEMGINACDPLEEILPGDNWAARLGELLESADGMVLFVSPDSAKSENTRREWLYGLSNSRFAGRFFVVQLKKTNTDDVPWALHSMSWITEAKPKNVARMVRDALRTEAPKKSRRGEAA